MAGLVPAISMREARPCVTKRDARDKRGHNEVNCTTSPPSWHRKSGLPDFRMVFSNHKSGIPDL